MQLIHFPVWDHLLREGALIGKWEFMNKHSFQGKCLLKGGGGVIGRMALNRIIQYGMGK